MTYRNTASYGKRQEFAAIAQLLHRGFDVYMTLVDDQGIDCVIRLNERRYLDVQIKARSASAKQWNFFAAMKFKPRSNLYFIFFTERDGNYWVIPSRELIRLCHTNRTGANAGRHHLTLPKRNDGEKARKFECYRNDAGFDLLRSQARPVRRVIRRGK